MEHARATRVALSLALVSLCGIGASPAAGAPAQRLKDVAPGRIAVGHEGIADLAFFDGRLYFADLEPADGLELWSSDGTPEGSRLVQDIAPGFDSSGPGRFGLAGNRMIFTAREESTGYELWSTDGSAAGTVLVGDLKRGGGSSNAQWVATLPGGTLVTANVDGASFCALLRTDGTPEGTVRLADVCVVEIGVVIDGTFFFTGSDARGTELWRSDGSKSGTGLVKEFVPGPEGGTPIWLTELGGRILFSAFDPDHGEELWTSDGTGPGTGLLFDTVPGPESGYPSLFAAAEGAVYFVTFDEDRIRLWRSDGTPQGTAPVATLPEFPTFAIAAGTRVIFDQWSPVGTTTLWASDGTEAGTVPLVIVEPGSSFGAAHPLGEFGGRTYLAAGSSTNGYFLWGSDGTVAGTEQVAPLGGTTHVRSRRSVTFGNAFYFSTATASAGLLWRSDGTPAGTIAVLGERELPASSSSSRDASTVAAIGGTYYFTADDRVHGTEVWKSDGTEAGTVLLKDARPGSATSFPAALKGAAGRLYYTAYGGAVGSELWGSDGTEAATGVVKDLCPCPFRQNSYELVPFGGGLSFMIDRAPGWELWRTDGTGAGTVRLAEGTGFGDISSLLTNVDGTLFFRDIHPTERFRLWTSDGTVDGTQPIKTFDPNLLITYGTTLAGSGGKAFIGVRTSPGGPSGLWTSDGTGAGTGFISPAFPMQMTDVAGTLFFATQDPEVGTELWASDGTGAGTRLVADIAPGQPGALRPGDFDAPVALGDQLIFAADDGVHGIEVWRSDGTPEGTALVKDIRPGPTSSLPSAFFAAAGVVFFAASDGQSGLELWRSDGTEGGTVLVQDLAPGVASSTPRRFRVAGTRLFFHADDGITGSEPWSGRLSLLAGRPDDALEELLAAIHGEGLPQGTENSLSAKIDRALRALATGDLESASRALEAFLHELRALSGKKSPVGTAAELEEFAASILDLIDP